MRQLLQLKSSLFAHHGQSSQLSDKFVAGLQAKHPQAKVITRDLAADPVPHLDGVTFQAWITKPEERTQEQQARVEFSDALIHELRSSDVVVIGLPMYNLGVPSTLKSYFDHVARAGETFRYTENGPQGLLTGKKAYVLATRGGNYQGTSYDTQTGYVRNFLGFIGITDVEFIYAEGLNMGEDSKVAALGAAHTEVERLTA